jgi:hypothetical protein
MMFYSQEYQWTLQHTVLSTKDAKKAALEEFTRAREQNTNVSMVTEEMFELKPLSLPILAIAMEMSLTLRSIRKC